MEIIRNITIGHTERLRKPVALTILANLVNIVPFCLSIEAVSTIFEGFSQPGATLDTDRLWTLSLLLFLYMGVMALAERSSYRANFRGAYALSATGRLSLAEHLRKLPLGILSRRDPGDLSSMLITDFNMAETGISHHLPQLIGGLVMPFLAFLSLLFIDWRMACSMFAALPLSALVLWMSSALQARLGRAQLADKINAGNRFEEYLQGIRVMKAYNLLGDRFHRLQEAFSRLRRSSIRQEAMIGPFFMVSVALIRSGLTLMVFCGSYLLLGGDLSLSTFVLFLVIGTRVFDPLTSSMLHLGDFRYYALAGSRILDFMHESEMSGTKPPPAECDIRFDGVSFGYRDKAVLHDLSVEFHPNTLTALVGPSGSGKSTLLKLCARFYDPDTGSVAFGGTPMRELDPEQLMQRMSMVFQDVYLFQDTIRNNIRFGKLTATDEEIEAAAIKACCHEFIMRLPQGYDTMVGEGGCTLSGGERQRLSIARAILKGAPVVLLDEATSSLDPENEVAVQRAIDTLIRDRTVIVIAHKLKTIMNADKIVVMDGGRVVEEGRHAELLDRGGLYKRMWDLQEQSSGWSVPATGR